MKRLIKKKNINKTASICFSGDLDSFVTKSGDTIALSCRVINNKPWFQVYQEGCYDISSYYDGDNYDKAARMYSDLLTAFCGVSSTEQFYKKINPQIKSDIEEIVKQDIEDSYNYESLKRSPLYLGMHSSEDWY